MAGMFYSLQEAAEKLNKTKEEIKEIAKKGKLREFRDGPNLLFKVDEVEALMSDTSIMPPQVPSVPSEPEPAVPLEPEPVVPLEQEPAIPFEPEPIVPLEPEPTVPFEQEPAVPFEPEPIVPLELEPVVPSEPEPVVPLEPELAVPFEPEPVVPLEPEPVVPLEPEPVVPLEPEPAVPFEPEPIVPLEPEPAVPLEPEPVVPLEPEPVVPLEPEPTVPLELEPAVPSPPEPVVPSEPEPTVPLELEPTVPFEQEPVVPLEPEPVVPLEPELAVPSEPEPVVPSEPEPTAPPQPEEEEISLAPESAEAPTPASELTSADTALAGEGVSILGETDRDYQVTEDTMAETKAVPSEASLEEIEEDVSLDSFGSGSGLLDLSLQADDTSLGGILDEIYTPETGKGKEAAEPGSAIEMAAEAEQMLTEDEFAGPQPAPVVHAMARAYIEPEPDTQSNTFGILLFLPLLAIVYTAIVAVAGFNNIMPAILEKIQAYIWYVMGGAAVVAIVIIAMAFMLSSKGPKAAKRPKAKRAKKTRKPTPKNATA